MVMTSGSLLKFPGGLETIRQFIVLFPETGNLILNVVGSMYYFCDIGQVVSVSESEHCRVS